MRNFTVRLPERVINASPVSGSCSCGMVVCAARTVERGMTTSVYATDKREAWTKAKALYPFDRIEIE